MVLLENLWAYRQNKLLADSFSFPLSINRSPINNLLAKHYTSYPRRVWFTFSLELFKPLKNMGMGVDVEISCPRPMKPYKGTANSLTLLYTKPQ